MTAGVSLGVLFFTARLILSAGPAIGNELVAVFLVLLALGTLRATPRARFVITACGVGLAIALTILVVRPHYGTDAVVSVAAAGRFVLGGHSPYHDFSLSNALRQFGLSPRAFGTFRRDGTVVDSFAYPPGAIVFGVVSAILSMDLRWLYLLPVLAVAAWAYRRATSLDRPAFGLLLVNALLVEFGGAGLQEPLALSLLALAVGFLPSGVSGLFLGLAVLAKQTAWPAVPLVLVWAFRRRGGRATLGLVTIAGTVVGLGCAPFLVSQPLQLLRGVLEPAIDNLPAAEPSFGWLLTRGGVPDALASSLSLVVMLLAFTSALLLVHRLNAAAVLLIGPLLFVFGWRGGFGYWYLGPTLVGALLFVQRVGDLPWRLRLLAFSALSLAAGFHLDRGFAFGASFAGAAVLLLLVLAAHGIALLAIQSVPNRRIGADAMVLTIVVLGASLLAVSPPSLLVNGVVLGIIALVATLRRSARAPVPADWLTLAPLAVPLTIGGLDSVLGIATLALVVLVDRVPLFSERADNGRAPGVAGEDNR